MHIGNNIKVLREKLGLTQLDFAEKIGVSRSAISYIEKKDSVDTKLLETISEVFNIPVIDIFYGNKEQEHLKEGTTPYEVNTVRDLHKDSSSVYRRFSDFEKNFSRSIAIEIYNEVKKCEDEAIDSYVHEVKSLISNIDGSTTITIDKLKGALEATARNWKKENRSYLK